MTIHSNVRTVIYAASFALLLAMCVPAVAQNADIKPKASSGAATGSGNAEAKSSAETSTEKSKVAFDADSDDDGISDAVEALASLKHSAEPKGNFTSGLQKDLTAGFRAAQQPKQPARHNTCMDYMLLSPEEKDRVNQKVQSRTLGAFGSRPCDPFVSPMLERPYDEDFVEIPLLPQANVVVHD